MTLSLAHVGAAWPGAITPGEYLTEGGWGNLTITANKAGGLAFEINAIGANGHTCGLSGEIHGDKATLEEGEEGKPCIVTFTPSAQSIEVSDNDNACRYYCGARAGFTGTYLKPRPMCRPKDVEKSRTEFKKLYDKKAYAQARARLEPVLKECAPLLHWSELGWLRNDLAITQYKLRDYAGCRKTLEPLVEDARRTDEELRENYPPTDAETVIPFARATRTNLGLCATGRNRP